MPGFNVIRRVDELELKYVPLSSVATAVGDLLERTAGATTWVLCTSSSNFFTRKAIAYEAVASGASQVLVYELKGDEEVEVDATNTANSAHNGDRMTLTDENAVNNTGTDVTGQAVSFVQDRPGSTTTKIIGRVLVGNGVDPDAA